MISFHRFAIALTSLSVLSLTACTTTSTQSLPSPSPSITTGSQNQPVETKPTPEVGANPSTQNVYLNDRCQPTDAQTGQWKVVSQLPFGVDGRDYLLSLITTREFGDDRKLCLSQANFRQSRELRLFDSFIDQITPDSAQTAVFQVKGHIGNGRGLPSEYYQLNLSNPAKPRVTSVKFAFEQRLEFDQRPTSTGTDSSRPDAIVFSDGKWSIAIGQLLSWQGENYTGNLFYRACSSEASCIALENGKAAQINGVFTASWENGDTSYVLSMPNSTIGQPQSSATLVVNQGQQEILRLTNLKQTSTYP